MRGEMSNFKDRIKGRMSDALRKYVNEISLSIGPVKFAVKMHQPDYQKENVEPEL